jgi:hypothetical protein
MGNQRRSFPELVGQNAQQAAAYITAQGNFFYVHLSMLSCIYFQCMIGLNPQILRENDPATRDLRFDRVRIIVDPTRTVVIRTPIVG